MRSFPFIPRSNKSLEPGDYWAVHLKSGQFACGRVLQVSGDELPTKTQCFFGGLQDWHGDHPPCDEDVRVSAVIDFGIMHVKAIRETGDVIIGNVALSQDLREVPLTIDSHGGPAARVLKGIQFLRSATKEEWGKLPVLGYWGHTFIKERAEWRFRQEYD